MRLARSSCLVLASVCIFSAFVPGLHQGRRAAAQAADQALREQSLGSAPAAAVATAAPDPARALPRSAPERQGISSSDLLAFVEAVDTQIDQMHSFLLVRHGQVVAEGWWGPYDAQTPHILYSLSKSFTSTAVGLAVAEGKLSLDDEVLRFFPEEAPAEPSANLRAMRVRDLLRMSTGHQTEDPPWRSEPGSKPQSETWTKRFLAQPVPFKPGTHFMYNSPATYMLSAIVQKVTGKTARDYLGPRLFEPLGIEKPEWVTSPEGVSVGAYGLRVRTEDIARFGQLYLQKGNWQGRQLLPRPGSTRRPRDRPRMGRLRRATGTRGMVINSGAAGTTPIVAMEHSGSTASFSLNSTPSWRSPAASAICRRR